MNTTISAVWKFQNRIVYTLQRLLLYSIVITSSSKMVLPTHCQMTVPSVGSSGAESCDLFCQWPVSRWSRGLMSHWVIFASSLPSSLHRKYSSKIVFYHPRTVSCIWNSHRNLSFQHWTWLKNKQLLKATNLRVIFLVTEITNILVSIYFLKGN